MVLLTPAGSPSSFPAVDYFEIAGLRSSSPSTGFHGDFPHGVHVRHCRSARTVPVVQCDARGRKSTKATLIALVEHAMAMQLSAR